MCSFCCMRYLHDTIMSQLYLLGVFCLSYPIYVSYFQTRLALPLKSPHCHSISGRMKSWPTVVELHWYRRHEINMASTDTVRCKLYYELLKLLKLVIIFVMLNLFVLILLLRMLTRHVSVNDDLYYKHLSFVCRCLVSFVPASSVSWIREGCYGYPHISNTS